MEFAELVEVIQSEPVFDTGLLLAGDTNPRQVRRQLSRWTQAGWDGPLPDEQNWQDILCQRLRDMDWKKIIADVKPFLERSNEVAFLTQENFERLLGCSPG